MNITFKTATEYTSMVGQVDILNPEQEKVGEIRPRRDEEDNWFFEVVDLTGDQEKRLNRITLTTLNHAKAVAEYHFNALEYAS